MPRTLLTCLAPAVAVTIAWLTVEEPQRVREAALVAGLAVLPALPSRWALRLALLALGGIVAVGLAFRVEPWELLPFRDEAVAGPVGDSVYTGVGDFYGVLLPFDTAVHPEMHALVLVVVFGFVAAVALLVATNRPYLAAGAAVAAVGWPATLVDAGAATAGALALAAALWIFVVGRARSAGALAVGALAACVVVVGATWLSSATSFAREAALQWESWDFRGLPAKALGVRFVWNAGYDGIAFPTEKTTVLEIEGPLRPQYWRVSTLDSFRADRWYEELFPRALDHAERDAPRDPLAPPAAADRDSWLEQEVTVKALVDDRVAAAGTPVAFDAPALGTVFYLSGGVVRARHELRAGTRYRVWSYVPDPSPAELTEAPATYPGELRRFFVVSGVLLPPFGREGRGGRMNALLADPSDEQQFLPHLALAPYRPLYEIARRVASRASNPYDAVLAIESWLRYTGGFRYEEQPVQSYDRPPLLEFVAETKAGYCQHFAGAMALMLRLLGIPARVAVGFTSGTLEGRTWKVTDHNAHAWVEVWFPRHGWVAFDPTPGRGNLSGIYSYASENAQAVAALGRGVRADQAPFGGRRSRGASRDSGNVDLARDDAPSLFGVALLALALWLLGVWAAKAAVTRARRMTRDPRRSATASRKELEAFLRDQGVDIPPSATLAWLQRASHVELGLDVRAFATAAAHGRFGPPEDASGAAEAARAELRSVLREARRELSPWARARGLVSLRSLRGAL